MLAAASLIAASAPPQQALADTPATQPASDHPSGNQIVFCDTLGLSPGTPCVESIAHRWRDHTDRWEHRTSSPNSFLLFPQWDFYDTTTCRMLHTHCGNHTDAQVAAITAASEAVPAHDPDAYPARVDINRYWAESEKAGAWHTYLIDDTGTAVLHLQSSSKPRNICESVISPDRRPRRSEAVLVAPDPDGVYRSRDDCSSWYLWDAETGNFLQMTGQNLTILSTSHPLTFDPEPAGLTWEPSQN